MTVEQRKVRLQWRGPVSDFLLDQTREIDLEGGLSAGKTTAALWKVYNSVRAYPGIWWYIGRYSDGDTTTKLCPAFEAVCQQAGETPQWHSDELYYGFSGESRVYAFGLKAQDHLSRYAKLRGLGVAGIYVDQTEELPADFAGELRARLRQSGYPHQLLFSPNPPNVTHWLAKEFPTTGCPAGRKLYQVSLYDNRHNLPPETIETLELAYPPSHAKYRSVIMGQRGMNVTGDPVYGGAFARRLHVRPLGVSASAPLLEAFDFGKHHPCWVVGQQPYAGGLSLLGGILGQDLFLDDFLPIVQQHRAQWFGAHAQGWQATCDPAGAHNNSQGVRYNGVSLLREAGWAPKWKDNANAPDVRGAMIERLAGYMRRRSPDGLESFGVNDDPDKWLLASAHGIEPLAFVADGFEAGYVWDEHAVSVGSKQITKAKKDGWYEHGMNAVEYLELQFGAARKTSAQQDAEALATARRTAAKRQRFGERRSTPSGKADLGWLG